MKNMTIQSNKAILVLWVLLAYTALLMHASPILAAHQEVGGEGDDEFSYIEGSDRGPERWGELKEKWATCGDGNLQSPINLRNERLVVTSKLGELKSSYKPRYAILYNRGHDIQLQWEGDAGFTEINGTKYFLKQIHWHHPSEHYFNGYRFDLEAHLVHTSANGGVAVVSIMYAYGRPDSFLSKLEKHIWSIAEEKTQEDVGVIDPNDIKVGGKRYYRYVGSLTTPPCTEGVIWTIYRSIMSVSRDQVKALTCAVEEDAKKNARPLQPLNNRKVYLYCPGYPGLNTESMFDSGSDSIDVS
ncbi:hypothetical protein Sjap_013725 [Stephania japonica]|uniref:Alpha-carbonic anhydrase domain-containing protein n=1 Tax=Stephania japonica TaxID=461633 RepID=A0AAP0IYL8_9MAGN